MVALNSTDPELAGLADPELAVLVVAVRPFYVKTDSST
jgi:hypothetical protein